jgi:hypothetical protein
MEGQMIAKATKLHRENIVDALDAEIETLKAILANFQHLRDEISKDLGREA